MRETGILCVVGSAVKLWEGESRLGPAFGMLLGAKLGDIVWAALGALNGAFVGAGVVGYSTGAPVVSRLWPTIGNQGGTTDGELDGKTVGLPLGLTGRAVDGLPVTTAGDLDCGIVGFLVGLVEGNVGLLLGFLDGKVVGWGERFGRVGGKVGTRVKSSGRSGEDLDGETVGALVGLGEGKVVGLLLGFFDGEVVGWGERFGVVGGLVGASVTSGRSCEGETVGFLVGLVE
jgi:hypothetical protein